MSTDGVGFLVDIGSKDGWTAAIKLEKRKIYIEKEKRKDIKLPGMSKTKEQLSENVTVRNCKCSRKSTMQKTAFTARISKE